MKITAKTTKEQLIKAIVTNFKAIKDKSLKEQIQYTSKVYKEDAKKVTKTDLVDLVKQIEKSLGAKFVEPAFAEETKTEAPKAENSVKPSGKKLSKSKNEPKVETPSDEPKETKKADKSANKASAVEVLEETPGIKQQRAKKFPSKVELEGNVYKKATHITDMDSLYTALNADEEILIAFYQPARNIKQFGYFNNLLGTPKSFDNDLDLTSVIYVSEEKKVAYSVSVYMEAPYTILPEDFEVVDGVKISGYLEFEVYKKA